MTNETRRWLEGAVFFTLFCLTIVVTRPFIGRFADRVGYRRVLVPCVALVVTGFALLALGGSRPLLIASAIIFGTGFGSAYPVFLAHVLKFVDPGRRGAAFGGILAAFDTGVGTGSIAVGAMAARFGFGPAFGVAAGLSAFSIPYFLWAERRFLLAPAARGGRGASSSASAGPTA